MINLSKKIGWGTLSIALFIFAILFSFNISRTFCLGDVILKGIGLKPYSGGNRTGMHYTVIYSLVFLVAGYLTGRFLPNDVGAKWGKRLCAIFAGIYAALLLFAVPGFMMYVM